jgi:molybdopterin molybdotransferase
MAEANCIILLGHDQANVNVGDMVDVVPFEGLV